MNSIPEYAKIVATLLGIAYPILFQVVSRLDEKYSSILIVDFFNKEKERMLYKYFLISSLIFFALWTFELKPISCVERFSYLIDNSAALLFITSTICLVISFFIFVDKIFVYYTPARFIKYLMKKHDRKDTSLNHFKALSEVFIVSIKRENHEITATLKRFFYDAFRQERDSSIGKPVQYPEAYYALVYRSMEEIARLKSPISHPLLPYTAGGVWLLGELKDSEISETTYRYLWINILLAVRYERDDFIIAHWKNAHQFFSFQLQRINAEYENGEIKNKESIEKRDREKKEFLEFHYALGGLLLYKNRYACISRLFRYTTSEPPSFYLLPERMNEIFQKYNEFHDRYEIKYAWISSKYGFPDLDGLQADGIVKKWICNYLALLFLRQYTIYPYLLTMAPLDFPVLPKLQGEKKLWIDNLIYFKKLISETLLNVDLLEKTHLNFLTKDWCEMNSKKYPLDFIDQLREKLQVAYSQGATATTLSEEKRQEFLINTKEIIERVLVSFEKINNKNVLPTDSNKRYISGQRLVQSKDAFSETPESDHLNYSTVLASFLSEVINEAISSSFLINRSKFYLLKPEDVFKAIDRLSINDDYIIIALGFPLEYYINMLKIEGLNEASYKNIKIVTLRRAGITRRSLFIVKNLDLPKILTLEIPLDVKEKYSLEKISDQFNLFANVLDLNLTTQEIRNENIENTTDEELRKSALLSINLDIEISWKKNVQLIEIVEYSEYRQNGLPNTLDDIISI